MSAAHRGHHADSPPGSARPRSAHALQVSARHGTDSAFRVSLRGIAYAHARRSAWPFPDTAPFALRRSRRCAGALAPAACQPGCCPDRVLSVLQQEQHPLRPLRLAHLHHRPLRDLLLPRARTAPRTDRELRRERLSAGQLRPAARPLGQGAADPVQDPQRVRAAERHPRARRRKASARSPSPTATACCCRSTIRRIGSTASSRTSSRTSSSSTSFRSR